ncbi:NADH pyrophosphatase [Pontimonas salivibrio]|uniref:NAD(+) diphosphatase n=1 Tax=Pontimonas salivibrio TaxID=1159327 RepID=A0A2L2BS54_9MICO|nr:NAD(+) diphosphatase [Pontimonas salivibrio]AVG24481.1 NADH pyrophosphatase [Pontimonas salivibrio]
MSLTPRLALSRAKLDRDAPSRAIPGLIDRLWADPDTKVVSAWRGEVLVERAEGLRLDYRSPESLPRPTTVIYLGKSVESDEELTVGTAVLAALYQDDEALGLEPDTSLWVSGRTSGHALGDRDAGVLVEALALANWHSAHKFSPATGEPLLSDSAGWVLVDQNSGKSVFPRTDAAIIVLITDRDDRIVLGSNALWETQRYSLLAGFVEPGESLEAAVAREVFEESGLSVKNPQYVGSQPWPFPASLMVGFTAQLDHDATGPLQPDGTEIIDLRWFSRQELFDSLDQVVLPGPTSIARAMIEHWYGEKLPESHW